LGVVTRTTLDYVTTCCALNNHYKSVVTCVARLLAATTCCTLNNKCMSVVKYVAKLLVSRCQLLLHDVS